jgi:ankyrin repeat protein
MNKESMLYRTHEIKSKILLQNNEDSKQSLFFYIKDDNFPKVKEILENKKISIEDDDADGNTPLNLAVQCKCFKIVEYLISLGADVNTQNVSLFIYF